MFLLILVVCLISAFLQAQEFTGSLFFVASVLQRTFQGLDASAGTNQPSVLEQGRSGVAQGYNELAERDSAI